MINNRNRDSAYHDVEFKGQAWHIRKGDLIQVEYREVTSSRTNGGTAWARVEDVLSAVGSVDVRLSLAQLGIISLPSLAELAIRRPIKMNEAE